MIRFQNVSKQYPDGSVALSDISFAIQDGEFLSFVGKSGAGKTTLLKLLLREEEPTGGTILFEGNSIADIQDPNLPEFRQKIGAIFQDYKLLPTKTAYGNVAYVMEMMGVPDENIGREVTEALKIVGLTERANHFPIQLSGGEKQRVAIARALIHRPKVIIADEPTGNLDPYHTRDIIRLLGKVNSLGTTVVLATHNKEIINRLGRRVITLENGRLIRDEERGRFII